MHGDGARADTDSGAFFEGGGGLVRGVQGLRPVWS